MFVFKKIKIILGFGPLLLFVFLLIEGAAVCFNESISYNIGMSYGVQVMLTMFFSILLFCGLIWFNRTLKLIRIGFLGKKKEMIVKGPFRYVRHPLYSTLMLTIPSFFMIWFNDYLFVGTWILIILVSHFVVQLEEKQLIREFGKSYLEYKSNVPPLLPCKMWNGRNF